MSTHITPLYAAVFAFIFVVLSARVILLRRRLRIAIGSSDEESIKRAIRVHGNFSEYVPFALLLLWMFEGMTHLMWLVNILAITLLVGRIIHAYGVSQIRENFVFRVTGMAMTFTMMTITAIRVC